MTAPDVQIAMANRLMREAIKPSLNPDQCACLFVFPAGASGVTTYVGTGDRPSMMAALREILSKWEAIEAKKRHPEQHKALEELVDATRPEWAGCTFNNIPLTDMTREQLLAVATYFGQRFTDQIKKPG
jgi:hypothetical protein